MLLVVDLAAWSIESLKENRLHEDGDGAINLTCGFQCLEQALLAETRYMS